MAEPTTENAVVPMPGMVWRREFCSLKAKGNEGEEYPVHEKFTGAVAHRAKLGPTKNRRKDGLDCK